MEERELTNRQAVGIGALAGYIVAFLIFSFVFPAEDYDSKIRATSMLLGLIAVYVIEKQKEKSQPIHLTSFSIIAKGLIAGYIIGFVILAVDLDAETILIFSIFSLIGIPIGILLAFLIRKQISKFSTIQNNSNLRTIFIGTVVGYFAAFAIFIDLLVFPNSSLTPSGLAGVFPGIFVSMVLKTWKEEQLTNSLVVWIGITSSVAIPFLGWIIYQLITRASFYWDDLTSYTFGLSIGGFVFGSPYGIAGALIGKNWKNSGRATWMGGMLGVILGAGSLFLALNSADNFYHRGFYQYQYVLFFLPGVPFGIIGALIGRDWKKTQRSMWIGGVLGTIIGIVLLGWLYAWASFGFSMG